MRNWRGNSPSARIQLDPNQALGYAIAGHHNAYHLRNPWAALPLFDRALEACPNHSLAWTLRSASLSYLGRGTEALESAQHGFNLSPSGPSRFYYQFFVGLAHYASGNEAESLAWLQLSLRDNPSFTSAHRILSAALIGLGRNDAARDVAAQMMSCEPRFRLSAYENDRAPFVDPAMRSQFIARLRAAGMPE